MKRIIAVTLTMCVLIMSACGSVNSPDNNDYTYLEDGSYYYASFGHTTCIIKSLPFNLDVENKAVPLYDVKFFEIHENHGYTAYLVITLSRESLTDDDIYWITRYDNDKFCKTLDVNVYVDSEPNNIDSELLNYMGGIYNDSYIHYVYSSDLHRYSFKDSSFNLQIIVAPSGITGSDTVYYYYNHLIKQEAYSDSIGSLTDSECYALKQSGYTGPFDIDNGSTQAQTEHNTNE